jgi:hypothetical protein
MCAVVPTGRIEKATMRPPFTIKQLAGDLTPVAGMWLVGHHRDELDSGS